MISFIVVCLFISEIANAYRYDPNDFATEVIDYVQGTNIGRDYITDKEFNEPNAALGRPIIDTTQDDMYHIGPVLPVYPAHRAFEVVTIGNGGRLTVKFNKPIENNANNPYGIDFIIFGNAFYGTLGWRHYNDDPAYVSLVETFNDEPGIVSVSQDGEIWYTFSGGPFADDFVPTLGRIYNPYDPNTSLGEWNLWWGRPTNPTLPLNPLLSHEDFYVLNLAQICEVYGDSAGGTGFDIGTLGLNWIQYVRIEDKPTSSATTEIDAISIAKPPYPMGDLNEDYRVDFFDFAILARDWQAGSDWEDMAALAENWLVCNWECP
jgi:hypothetical protein